ncbi:MAG: IS5 family transposase [Hyphomonadaceae bacterium]
MPPKSPPLSDHDLFRMRLEAMIDGRHELVRLAKLIDWKRFEEAFGALYDENRGRPALPTRLMAGLHLLKHIKGLSDEQVCAQWVENPYFQAFCGEKFFRHELPLDRSSMTRWRGRIGPEKLEVLLAETIAVATKAGAVSPREMERVTVDTTVATKAVAHPTDSHLLLRAIEWMNRAAKKAGIMLRQSFLRLAQRARREVGRLLHTGGHAQGLRHLRRMRTFAGRLWRDITRKAGAEAERDPRLALVLERVGRLLAQKPQDRDKLYALHAPEVECIGKGKARVRYEFGVKCSLAVTNARAAGGQFVLGARTVPGNPYDGHTLADQIAQVEALTGQRVRRVYVDRGYRGNKLERKGLAVILSHTRAIASPTIRREMRRRNAIEPVIGHLKSDGLLERNHLRGATGDAINIVLAAAGQNLRLLLRWLRLLCALIIAAIIGTVCAKPISSTLRYSGA